MAKSTRYDEVGNAVIREARPASNVRTAPRDVKAKGPTAVAAWNKANKPQPGKTEAEATRIVERQIYKRAADMRAKKTIASTARSFSGGQLLEALSANNGPKVASDAPTGQKRAAVASGMAARAANRTEAGGSDGGPKRRAAERFARVARGERPFGGNAAAPRVVTPNDFDFSKAPLYRKTARLSESQVAVAKGGEEIVTRQPDGKGGSFVETKRTAKAGDRIVTRSPGDSYVVSSEKWDKLYERDPSKPGEYRSRSTGRAVRVKEDVQIKAPWGEMQTIKKGGVIFRSEVDGSVYGNQKQTFGADFAKVKSTSQAKPAKASSAKRQAAVDAYKAAHGGREPPKSMSIKRMLSKSESMKWGYQGSLNKGLARNPSADHASTGSSFIDKVNAAQAASDAARRNAPKPPATPPGPREHWNKIGATPPTLKDVVRPGPGQPPGTLTEQQKLALVKSHGLGGAMVASQMPTYPPKGVTNDSAMGMKPPAPPAPPAQSSGSRLPSWGQVNTGLAVVGTGVAAAQAFNKAKQEGKSTGEAMGAGALAATPGALMLGAKPIGNALSKAGDGLLGVAQRAHDAWVPRNPGLGRVLGTNAAEGFVGATGLLGAGAKAAGAALKVAGKAAAPAMAVWGAYQGAKEDSNAVRGAARGALRSLDPTAIVTGIGAGTGLMKDGRGLGERAYDAVFGGPTQGRVSAGQAQTFAKADANYDHMGQGQPQATGERSGWSPEARIAAAQARGAVNLPYGGDPTQAPGYVPPKDRRPY